MTLFDIQITSFRQSYIALSVAGFSVAGTPTEIEFRPDLISNRSGRGIHKVVSSSRERDYIGQSVVQYIVTFSLVLSS